VANALSDDRSRAVSEASLARAESYIEQEEGAASRFRGWIGWVITALALAMSIIHLYGAVAVLSPQVLRPLHVGFALVLCFLVYPIARRFRNRLMPWDLVLAAAAIAVIAYVLVGGEELTDRNSLPTATDMLFGVTLIVLVLEAVRRTTGIVMPVIVIGFVLYALFGDALPSPWNHRGYGFDRLAGHLYQTLEGIFGTAIDVSATLIILFTIYGAVLQESGAGKFFIDFSFSAMGGRSTGAGRTIVLASFLLGGPSGSGVATTVTLGSVAYPMLARAGYSQNTAGGLLAAGGLGAILSPPVLGAAAFLIAEFLKISYLDVIVMATIPTCLYYFSLLIMVEIDTRKYRMREVAMPMRESLWELTRSSGYHFLSLVAIVALMVLGATPMQSVFFATFIALAVSALGRDSALLPWQTMLLLLVGAFIVMAVRATPAVAAFAVIVVGVLLALGAMILGRGARESRLVGALANGSIGMLNVAATCAAAGIIVGVVTLTGLGLKFSSIVIAYAGGSVVLTAIYTALIVWIVGLAVPVTASYIICAVIAAPALIKLGVPDFAAHMFIFYYAVLSEVSPPTALSPFAAAAITGGGPYRTTLQAWKYTVPAFIVPLMFVLEPAGSGLLLHMPKGGDLAELVLIILQAAAGIAALAAGFQQWLLRRTSALETVLLLAAGALLVVPRIVAGAISPLVTIAPVLLPIAGILLLAVVAAVQWGARPRPARTPV
jgi:TRAP transporter 4TM/12TM fusion protein